MEHQDEYGSSSIQHRRHHHHHQHHNNNIVNSNPPVPPPLPPPRRGFLTMASSCLRGGNSGLPLTSRSHSTTTTTPSKQKHNTTRPSLHHNNKTSRLIRYLQRGICLLVLLRFSVYLLWMHTYLALPGGGRILDTSSTIPMNQTATTTSRVTAAADNVFQPYKSSTSSLSSSTNTMNANESTDAWTWHQVEKPHRLVLPSSSVSVLDDQNHQQLHPPQPFSSTFAKKQTTTTTKLMQTLQKVKDRARERRARTRPNTNNNKLQPPPALAMIIRTLTLDPLFNAGIPKSTIPISAHAPTTTTTTTAADSSSSYWSSLCQQASLDRTSHVVITNILTSDMATSFALFASRQCHVQSVTGVDTLFPNTRHYRMDRLDANYRLLLRHISNFTLVKEPTSTEVGLMYANQKGGQPYNNNNKWWMDSLSLSAKKSGTVGVAPTHIVHVERSILQNDDNDLSSLGSIMDAHSQRLYALSHSMSTWQHALVHAASFSSSARQQQQKQHSKQKKKNPSAAAAPVSVIHVSVPTTSSSLDATTISTTAIRLSPIVSLAQTGGTVLSSAVHLQFPTNSVLVGPLVESKRTSMSPPTKQKKNDAENHPVLFVDDAMTAILIALGEQQKRQRTSTSSSTGISSTCSIVQAQPQWSLSRGEWLQAMDVAASANTTTATKTTTSALLDVPMTRQRVGQTLAWKQSQEHPYGRSNPHNNNNNNNEPVHSVKRLVSERFFDTYGIQPRRFPCSSSCFSSSSEEQQVTCLPSAWDESIRSHSRRVSKQCRYVVYLVDLTRTLNTLVMPIGGTETTADAGAAITTAANNSKTDVCRIAFVSGKSQLVQSVLASKAATAGDNDEKQDSTTTTPTEEQLVEFNGKLQYNQWTLIWLPNNDNTTINDADGALPRIDPAGLFAETVSKALYAETQALVEPSDFALTRILSQIDRPALGQRKVKEKRSGTKVSRFVAVSPEPARHTVLFAGEPKESTLPKSMADFVRIAGNRYNFPPRQLTFYKQVAQLVQTSAMRPESEIWSTEYSSFPFQWITMSILVHDLNAEISRQFRCSWLDEYLYWGSGNRNAEELSYAYVMARSRIQGAMGPPLEDDASWSPLLVAGVVPNNNDGTDKHEQQRLTNPKGGEFFVRLMKHRDG